MFRRSFESQDVRTLAVRFRVWLVCAVPCLPRGVSIALLKSNSILYCLALCCCGPFFLSYNSLGTILNKNSNFQADLLSPFLFFLTSLFHESHVYLLS